MFFGGGNMDRIQFFIDHRAKGVRRITRSVMSGHITLYRRGEIDYETGKTRWIEVEVPGDKLWTFGARSAEDFSEFSLPWICGYLARRLVRSKEESTATHDVWEVETEIKGGRDG